MKVAFWRPVDAEDPPRVLQKPIAPPAPNEVEQEEPPKLITRVGFPLLGVGVVAIMIYLLIKRGGGFNPVYILFPLMMMVSMGGMMYGQKGGKSKGQVEQDRKAVSRGVGAAREKVSEHGLSMHKAMQNAYPDPKMLAGIVGTKRMWQVQPTSVDFDFSAIRFGIGEVELGTQMTTPEAPPGEFLEPVSWVSVVRFLRHQSTLSNIPVALTTSRFPVIGFTGDRKVSMGMLRSMLVEGAVTHGPDNLRIVLLTDDPDGQEWSWMKWLPHTQHPYEMDKLGSARMMYKDWSSLVDSLGGNDDSGRPPLIDFMSQHDPDVEFGEDDLYRQYLIVVDSKVRDNLLDSTIQPRAGVTWMLMDPPKGALTDDTGLVLSCDADRSVWRKEAELPHEAPVKVAVADQVSVGNARVIARQLARYENATIDAADVKPGRVERGKDWATLMRIKDPGNIDLHSMWGQVTKWDDPRRLKVPIGFLSNGERFELDLKEIGMGGMGPHGMIIGFTGSGKSEFLRNLVLNLMVTHSPDILNMLLTDFKGGATFLGLDNEPHVTAVITNMEDEAHLVARMEEAITGELNRRDEIFREANRRYPKADIKNIHDYQRLRSRVTDLDPLPYLLVIVDEFAELLEAHPEYGDIFKQIGRKGRSMGVHLLFAAQSLEVSGRTAGLEANVSYKIGLKTMSTQDSRQLLGSDAAYRLPGIPGHAVIKAPGLSELVHFYSGYTGAPYFKPVSVETETDDDANPVTVASGISVPEPLPFTAAVQPLPGVAGAVKTVIEPERSDEEIENAPTLFTTIIDQLRAATDKEPYRMYLPPLSAVTLDQIAPELQGWKAPSNSTPVDLHIPMGLFDNPVAHAQPPWIQDMNDNIMIIGGQGTGKSTTVATMIASLGAVATQQQVQMFVADFLGGIPGRLADLPHIGGWATSVEPDAVNRTIAEMQKIRRDREALFRQRQIENMEHYRQLRAQKDSPLLAEDPYGDVFFFIDGWDVAVAEGEVLSGRADEIIKHFAGGKKYGLHLVIATGGHTQTRSLLRHIKTLIELHNENDASMVDTKLAKHRRKEPGHVLVTGSELYGLVSLPRIDGLADPVTAIEGVEDLVSTVSAALGDDRAEKLKTLPTSLLRDTLQTMAAPVAADAEVRRRLRLPIGIRESSATAAYAEFHIEPHLLLMGEAKSGRSEAIDTLIHGIAERFPSKDEAVVFLYDPRDSHLERIPETNLFSSVRSDPQFVSELKRMLTELKLPERDVPDYATAADKRERNWWTGPEVFIIIDDYDLVAPRGSTPPVHELIGWVRKDGFERGIHVIIATNSDNIGVSLMSDPIIKQMSQDRAPALLLSTDKLQGAYGNTKFVQHGIPGRATYVEVKARRNERVQLAWSGEANDEYLD